MLITTLTWMVVEAAFRLWLLALFSAFYDNIHDKYIRRQHRKNSKRDDEDLERGPRSEPRCVVSYNTSPIVLVHIFRTSASQAISIPIYLALTFFWNKYTYYAAHWLVNVYASYDTRYECLRYVIRGHDCPTAYYIRQAMAIPAVVALACVIRGLKLHKDRRQLGVRWVVGIVLGVPVAVLRVQWLSRHNKAALRVVDRLMDILLVALAVSCCLFIWMRW